VWRRSTEMKGYNKLGMKSGERRMEGEKWDRSM
jgi:hypothetical protein